MSRFSRRSFIKLSATAAVCQHYARAAPVLPLLIVQADGARFRAPAYTFAFSAKTDTFTVSDNENRIIFTAPLQPSVCLAPRDAPESRICTKGTLSTLRAEGKTLHLAYDTAQGALRFQIRFDSESFWIDPIAFEGRGAPADVVSVYYFGTAQQNHVSPALHATYTTLPAISEGPSISPVQSEGTALETSITLGRAGFYVAPYLHQQWGLPTHYFCATSTTTHAIDGGRADTFTRHRSRTAICGVAEIPNGDIYLDLSRGKTTLWLDYRSDIWHHMPAQGNSKLGCMLVFTFGDDQRSAAVAYGERLVSAGLVERKKNSPAKNAAVFAPEFCTWGEQVVRNMVRERFTQTVVEGMYEEMKASRMKAGIFSIDDKWEGRYGNLEHDKERFPHFVEFLNKVRSEGRLIGLWAAFMRCERPDDLGLTTDNMLKTPDGKPYMGGRKEYYLLDFTQPKVATVLAERARNFMRVYKPALVKFDFGYELPAMRVAAPSDKSVSGERLLQRGLDIVIGALRDVNPDVVVMYYQLAPLFTKYFDLHSTDDLYITAGDYDYEANRRIYMGGALSTLGVAVYGSSGYDWSSSPSIWFDSVVSGTIGCLNDLKGDEFGEKPTANQLAMYNGMARAIRPESNFEVIVYPPSRPESAIRGLHTKSWARSSNGKITMVAQRPGSFDDGDSIDHRDIDRRVANLVKTSAPVVLSSLTDEGLSMTKRMIVVPCGEGQVSLRRVQGNAASITTHCFGGSETTSRANIENGWLIFSLSRVGAGGPVEYLEVTIS